MKVKKSCRSVRIRTECRKPFTPLNCKSSLSKENVQKRRRFFNYPETVSLPVRCATVVTSQIPQQFLRTLSPSSTVFTEISLIDPDSISWLTEMDRSNISFWTALFRRIIFISGKLRCLTHYRNFHYWGLRHFLGIESRMSVSLMQLSLAFPPHVLYFCSSWYYFVFFLSTLATLYASDTDAICEEGTLLRLLTPNVARSKHNLSDWCRVCRIDEGLPPSFRQHFAPSPI